MTWTTPVTWSAAQVPTAANFNSAIRDNFNTLAPAVCTATGDTFYATGANALSRLAVGTNYKVLTMNAGQTAPAWGEAYTPLDVVTQDAEILSNAAETAVYTSPDIGSPLETWSIRFEWWVSYLNNTGSTQTLSLKIKLDTTTIFTPISNVPHTTITNRRGTVMNYVVLANGSATSQKHMIGYQASTAAGALLAMNGIQSSIMNYSTSAINLGSGSHYVTMTVDHGAASNLLSVIVRLSGMWLMRAV